MLNAHLFVNWCSVCVVYLWLLSATVVAQRPNEASAAFAIDVAEFAALAPGVQAEMLVAAVEHRLEHGRNLQFELWRTLQHHAYENGEIGEVHYAGPRIHRDRYWRLGDSYRLEADSYKRSDRSNVVRTDATGFDAMSKTVRSTGQLGYKRPWGRIDVVENEMVDQNRYGYWLDGDHSSMAENIFRYLLDHKDSMIIEVPYEERYVKVTLPWSPGLPGTLTGTREFRFDPAMGFYPVRGYGHWEAVNSPDGKQFWRTEEFFALEPKLIGDVWMPLRLREVIDASTAKIPHEVVEVRETEVISIEQGTVTPDDLKVVFVEGMEVVDAIKGVTYVADADGSPKGGTSKGLIGAKGITAIRPPGVNRVAASPARDDSVLGLLRRNWLIFTNLGAILMAVACAIYWRRSRLGQSSKARSD